MKHTIKFNIIVLLALITACQPPQSTSDGAPQADPNLTPNLTPENKKEFEDLLEKSAQFAHIVPFPTSDNLVKNIAQSDTIKARIVQQMKSTYPIIHTATNMLIKDFLSYKKSQGSQVEKELYKNMSTSDFIYRLIKNRPLAFLTSSDTYLLRDGTKGTGGFEKIGRENPESFLPLKDYISYDEMQISALLSMSTPTYFINDGARQNHGKAAQPGTFEPEGIYVGQVGARFERPDYMEWSHMIITPTQNTSAHGYGAHATPNPLLKIWKKFYGLQFASYAEAQADTSGRFIKFGGNQYFDSAVYKKRMAAIIEPFLLDAHSRAQEQHKKAYVHVVGLGLGVWEKVSSQGRLLVEVYADILNKHALRAIADINFSYFPDDVISCGGITNGQTFSAGGNNIVIYFSKRNPAALLTGNDKGKLLVASYAWDSNSYPGNEYWLGYIGASGDPAAASCSTIPELQNPQINTNINGDRTVSYGNKL